jgi:hypothetical protein
MNDKKNRFQLIWGIMLAAAGLGVFYRIPQVMPKIEQIRPFASGLFFIRLCLYLMGILLLAGGGKKIMAFFREPDKNN